MSRASGHPIDRWLVGPTLGLLLAPWGGLVHVNVRVGGWLYDVSDTLRMIGLDDYPAEPHVTLSLPMSRLWANAATDLGMVSTPWLTVLDALRFPIPAERVRSCVTWTGRLLGVERRCRTPAGLLEAIREGDYDHGRSLPCPQGEGHATA